MRDVCLTLLTAMLAKIVLLRTAEASSTGGDVNERSSSRWTLSLGNKEPGALILIPMQAMNRT